MFDKVRGIKADREAVVAVLLVRGGVVGPLIQGGKVIDVLRECGE